MGKRATDEERLTKQYNSIQTMAGEIEELQRVNDELKARLLEEQNKNRKLLDPSGQLLPPLTEIKENIHGR